MVRTTPIFFSILAALILLLPTAKGEEQQAQGKPPGAFALMSLEQLGRLNHASRVQYLELMRETLVEFERAQNAFGIEMANNSPEQQELYALVLGSWAFAADKFYRNLNRGITDDGCIYGGHYQKYQAGKGAYGCVRPSCTNKVQRSWKAPYAKGKTYGKRYVQCSFATYGIEWCVTPGINSTEGCEKKSREFEKRQGSKVTQWLKENITNDWKKGSVDERLKMLGELRARAFDPRVMSHLVKLAADYQKVHKNFDKIPGLHDFKSFDVATEGMNALFRSFKEHCTKEMDENTAVKSVEKERGPLAKRRQRYLKQVRDKGRPVRVGSVLQRKECEILIGKYNIETDKFSGGRYKRLMDAYETIARQGYPDHVPDRPKTISTQDDVRQEIVPVEKVFVPKKEIVPVDPNAIKNAYVTGCKPTNPLLTDRGMQCAKCVVEKSIREGEPNSYVKGSGISEKWLSLMSTMIQYCNKEWGQSRIDPRDLPHLALKYAQTFGHCSKSDYKWDNVGWNHQQQVKNWQMGRNLEQTVSPTTGEVISGSKDHFKNIYGISINHAKNLFCDLPKDRRTGQSFYERFRGHRRRAMAQRREAMFQAHESHAKDYSQSNNVHTRYAKTGVARCIESIKKRRKQGTLFSSTNKPKRCQGLIAVRKRNMSEAVEWAKTEQPVMAVDTHGHCYVTDTTYEYNNGKVQMVFSSPATGGSPRPIYTVDKGGKSSWQVPDDERIVFVSVGGESPEKTFCPDDRGRKGHYIPPTPHGDRSSQGAQ